MLAGGLGHDGGDGDGHDRPSGARHRGRVPLALTHGPTEQMAGRQQTEEGEVDVAGHPGVDPRVGQVEPSGVGPGANGEDSLSEGAGMIGVAR